MRVIVALVVVALSSGPAGADPQSAAQHHEHGKELFKAKDYPGAVTEFAAAYAGDPQPKYLYNLAQAQRFSGDCKAAIASYEKFLATAPEPDDVGFANAGIAKCKESRP